MPVINFSYSDLARLSSTSLTREEFLELVPLIGADVDRVAGDDLAVEFFPNRPDLYSVEGVARAMEAFTGRRPGLRRYEVAPPQTTLTVEPPVVEVRPYVVGGLVKGVELSEAAIVALMELQEKLHLTMGRKRAKVSIGVHDLDAVTPPFRYTAVAPEAVRFVPLQESREMDLAAILTHHPKGRDYAHLLAGCDRYPLILDAHDRVLSFPPIINSTLTTVTEATTNIFLDVTGLDLAAVSQALNIVACGLAERGGGLEAVEVAYPADSALGASSGRTLTTPDLEPRRWVVGLDYLYRLLGWQPGAGALVEAFQRMGLGAAHLEEAATLEVLAPAYRRDLLHTVDLVEEAAIGLGYLQSPEVLPAAMTFGSRRQGPERGLAAREAMVGLGFQETTTLTLSGPEAQFQRMGLAVEAVEGAVTRLANPIGSEYSLLRISLLPGLLEVLSANTHRELPQRLFEVGEVVVDHANVQRVAFVELSARASFSRAKGLAEALLRQLGCEAELERGSHPSFTSGRCAQVITQGNSLGHFGEVAPATILAWELAHPLLAGEFDLP